MTLLRVYPESFVRRGLEGKHRDIWGVNMGNCPKREQGRVSSFGTARKESKRDTGRARGEFLQEEGRVDASPPKKPDGRTPVRPRALHKPRKIGNSVRLHM